MKLSNFAMKVRTAVKSKAVRVLAAGALAGAIFTAAAPAAQAQRVFVEVHHGGPRYFAPGPPVRFYGPVYPYGFYRHDDWRFRHDFYRRGWR